MVLDPSLRLFRYRLEHREQMLALHRGALADFTLGMSQREDDAGLMAVEQVHLSSGGEFLIGLRGDRLFAMGGFKPLSDSPNALRRMRVEPELQGRGCGTQSLRELERIVFQIGTRTP